MRIDWSTLALQTVNALVLVWLLARFLFRPIAEIVTKRQQAARKVLEDARAVRVAAEAELKTATQEAERLANGRSEALRQVELQVSAERTALLASARAEADALRQTAAAELDASRAARARSVGTRATKLAVDITEKLLDRLPERARVEGFIDGLGDGLKRLPAEARAELCSTGAALRLTAARALSEQEEKACRAVLAGSLGRPVTVAVHIDPSLIAGLELDGCHVHVRNSFRHDLEQLEAMLMDDDGPDD